MVNCTARVLNGLGVGSTFWYPSSQASTYSGYEKQQFMNLNWKCFTFSYFLTSTVTTSISRRCIAGIKSTRHAQLQMDLDLQAIASSLHEADKSWVINYLTARSTLTYTLYPHCSGEAFRSSKTWETSRMRSG